MQWLVALMLGITFTGCQTPATPKVAKVSKPSTNLHTVIRDVALYKGYKILQDNRRNAMVIKYSRVESWSITYKVEYTQNSYTMSYLDSKNLKYKNGKISTTYTSLISSIQGTVKKCLADDAYYARLKKIVSDRATKPAAISVQPKSHSTNAQSVENYNFFED